MTAGATEAGVGLATRMGGVPILDLQRPERWPEPDGLLRVALGAGGSGGSEEDGGREAG